MNLRMDGWKVSREGGRLKMVEGPCWAVVTFFRAYGGREVPESQVVESLHKDRPALEHLIEKYHYPAPGSLKRYDFAYGRMATAVAYREAGSFAATVEPEDAEPEPFQSLDADDLPGVETVYRKVEVVRLPANEVKELYLDWARTRILREGDGQSLEFALHVLAELGGEI
jgi:hypothetical protein